MELLPAAVVVALALASGAHRNVAEYSSDTARVLVYPDQGGLHKFVVGISVPVDVPKKFLSWAVNFQFQYQMPQNISEISQNLQVIARGRAAEPSLTRKRLYRYLEEFLHRNDVDGEACLLRTVCEVAEMPIKHNGLLGQLLHIFFTPIGEEMDQYRRAQEAGSSSGQDCKKIYSSCPPGHGLLDLIAYDAP